MLSSLRLITTLLLYTITSDHTTTAWTVTTTSISMMSSSSTNSSPKITVVGGTGFVGSRVCRTLIESGASVTSVSKSGTVPAWCAEEPWTKEVSWKSLDLLSSTDDANVDEAVGKPEAMVSCVGVVGTDRDLLLRGNGDANALAFASGKRGGMLKRTVLVSVASEVKACEENWLPEFFGGYFEGKRIAEEAARDAADACTIVAPSFIYGGDSFALLPPRVTQDYGSAIEQLLSYGIITFLGDVAPGLIGVALRPPSSVDAVAAACAKVALGEEGVVGDVGGGVIDGGAAINAAGEYPASTGLTEAITWAKDGAVDAYKWVKAKIDENAENR